MNYPNGKWGCEADLRKCAGKTIEAVELIRMEWGCTWDNAWLVRFTDGSRAFFAGQPGTGIMNPSRDAIEGSAIFTPDELAEVVADDKRRSDARKREQEKRDRAEYERLAERFGNR